MVKPNLIGITGKIGSGKDTVSKMIQYYQFIKNKPEECEISLLDFLNGYDTYDNDYSYGELTEYTISQDSGWKIKKFAYKLKQIAGILLGCSAEDFESQDFKDKVLGDEWQMPHRLVKYQSGINNKYTNRWFLQQLGTEAIRNNINSDTWINALFSDYKLINNSDSEKEIQKLKFPNWIISDVRFLNEAKSIKDRDGILLRIIRGEEKQFDHISEVEQEKIKCDYFIQNNGTIEELYQSVVSFLNH